MEAFHNLKIPVPKSSVKIQEWVDKISKPYDEKNEKQSKVKQLEIDIQNRIQGITENEECVEVGFNDLCLTKKGKPLCKENFIIGIYPVIGGGISPTGYHNDYNMEFNTILCSSSGNNAGYISKYNSRVWASDCFSIHSKNINVSNSYMYYLLRYKQNDIFELQKGSAQPHIYSNDLVNNITFRIPKDKQLMTDMDSMFQEIEILQTDIKNADELYKLYIQELGNEAKQCNILAFNEEPIVVINEPVQEPIIKIRIIRRKKAV
jgi:restriction endonuclease S subunit